MMAMWIIWDIKAQAMTRDSKNNEGTCQPCMVKNTRGDWLTQQGCTLTERKEGGELKLYKADILVNVTTVKPCTRSNNLISFYLLGMTILIL